MQGEAPIDGLQSSRDRVKFFSPFLFLTVRKKNEPDLCSCVISTKIVGLNLTSFDVVHWFVWAVVETQVFNFDEVGGSRDLFLKLTRISDLVGTHSHATFYFVSDTVPG